MYSKLYKKSASLIFILLLFSLTLSGCGALPLIGEEATTTPAVSPSPTSVPVFKGSIVVGGIFDLSGASAVEGREYAAGAVAYTNLFNTRGGANGYKLDLRATDFAAKAPVAIEEYQKLLKDGAVAFLAWDIADTLALTRQLKEGHVPLFSASYSEELVRDVKQQPYNFMIAPSYSDQIKIALLYAKHNRPDPTRSEQAMVAYLYSDDNFGRFPYQTGRDYSSAHKITWFHEGVLQPKIDQSNLLFEANRLKTARPEYTFVQAKPPLVAEMLKAMRAVEASSLFLGLNYSGSTELPKLAGKAAEGFMAMALMAYPDEQEPGLAEMRGWLLGQTLAPRSAASPTSGVTALPNGIQLTERFVQGWVTMKVLAEGIRRAVAANQPVADQPLKLDGDKVKEALETLYKFDTGGITPPISFSPTRHKGSDSVRIMKVENGQWKAITPYLSLADLEYQDSLPPTPTPASSRTPTPKR